MSRAATATLFIAAIVIVLGTAAVRAATPVLTRSYNNGRTGANTSETLLTPQILQSGGLKRLKSLTVDDDDRLEAQPLYVPGLQMADGKDHNVVFVATMANQIWAFDADAPEGTDLLWKTSLGRPLAPKAGVQVGPKCVTTAGVDGHRCTGIDWWGINIHWGILATPVIDVDTSTMFIANWVVGENGKPALFLHHIRLRDGGKVSDPLPILATRKTSANGEPAEAAGNTVVLQPDQKVRAALLLSPLRGLHKTLFAATTGGESPGAPHGWVVAFDVDTFRPTASWVSTPSSFGGGIWEGGQGLASDSENNVYAMTGNGGYLVDNAGHLRDFEGDTDFAEAFVKLEYAKAADGTTALNLADWFIPFSDAERQTLRNYDYRDQDLGSAAPVVPPGARLVFGAGKDGLLYVLDLRNFGRRKGDLSVLKSYPPSYVTFNGVGLPTSPGASGHEMDFPLADPARYPNKTHHLHGSPVFWDGSNGPMIFTWGENESVRAWHMDLASGAVSFVGRGAEIASADLAADPKSLGGMTGGMLTLSSNGKAAHSGIVWATAPLNGDANHDVVEGVARAYDATELDSIPIDSNTPRLKLLWDSKRAGVTFHFSKFCPPFVADGRLYVSTYDGRVDVYVPN